MKNLALNCNTFFDVEIVEQIKITSNVGFRGIGLKFKDIQKYLEEGHDLCELHNMLDKYNLTPVEMSFGPGWQFTNGQEKIQALERAEKTMLWSKEIGCNLVIACASKEKGTIDNAIRDFFELCKIADNYGIRMGLEFLGFAHTVKDLSTAWEIVRNVNLPNAGITLDTFHFYKGGSEIQDLELIPMDKIFIVHLSDAPDMNKYVLNDSDRVYPSSGIIPLKEMINSISKRNYKGFFSLELLNPKYWEYDPKEMVKKGYESMRKVSGESRKV